MKYWIVRFKYTHISPRVATRLDYVGSVVYGGPDAEAAMTAFYFVFGTEHYHVMRVEETLP